MAVKRSRRVASRRPSNIFHRMFLSKSRFKRRSIKSCVSYRVPTPPGYPHCSKVPQLTFNIPIFPANSEWVGEPDYPHRCLFGPGQSTTGEDGESNFWVIRGMYLRQMDLWASPRWDPMRYFLRTHIIQGPVLVYSWVDGEISTALCCVVCCVLCAIAQIRAYHRSLRRLSGCRPVMVLWLSAPGLQNCTASTLWLLTPILTETVEKSLLNATIVTIHLLGQVIWRIHLKTHGGEKSLRRLSVPVGNGFTIPNAQLAIAQCTSFTLLLWPLTHNRVAITICESQYCKNS